MILFNTFSFMFQGRVQMHGRPTPPSGFIHSDPPCASGWPSGSCLHSTWWDEQSWWNPSGKKPHQEQKNKTKTIPSLGKKNLSTVRRHRRRRFLAQTNKQTVKWNKKMTIVCEFKKKCYYSFVICFLFENNTGCLRDLDLVKKAWRILIAF